MTVSCTSFRQAAASPESGVRRSFFSMVEDGVETPAQFYPHSRYFALRGMVAISAQ